MNRIKKIYDSSPDEVKKSIRIYIQSIGKNEKNITKPTIDDYTTIRSYEDACEALGAEPIFNDPNPIMNLYGVDYEVPPHIIALMKLELLAVRCGEKIGCRSRMQSVQSGSIIQYLGYIPNKRLKTWMKMNVGACCVRVRLMVRLRASVICTRIIVPRMRLRTMGSACVKKRAKRLSISASSSLNCGRNT